MMGGDFCEDPQLPLPKGEEWDERGKKDTIHHVFKFSILFNFYFIMLRQVKMVYADIGPVRLARMSPIERWAGVRYMVVHRSEANEDLRYIEENLQRLTIGIPDATNVILRESRDGFPGYYVEWLKPLYAIMIL